MEFNFCINDLLLDRVTCVDGTLLPDAFKNGDKQTVNLVETQIAEVLDKIGVSSGIAQGLQTPVTSADRLRNSDHRVYLLTNPEGDGGRGTVIGLLKVGRKKLYIFDKPGKHHELTPMCVLDFYVHESTQRAGFGRFLYDYMLKEEHLRPENLALDRPSDKLTSFLQKHYDLVHIIPQSNNFVVYDRFFNSPPEDLPGYKTSAVFDYRRAAGKSSFTVAPASGRAFVNRPADKILDANNSFSNGDIESPVHAPSPRASFAASLVTEDTPEAPVQGDLKFQHQRLW